MENIPREIFESHIIPELSDEDLLTLKSTTQHFRALVANEYDKRRLEKLEILAKLLDVIDKKLNMTLHIFFDDADFTLGSTFWESYRFIVEKLLVQYGISSKDYWSPPSSGAFNVENQEMRRRRSVHEEAMEQAFLSFSKEELQKLLDEANYLYENM